MTSVPSSELRDRIAAALSEAGAFCGECGFEPGETGCPDCVRVRAMYTDAVLATVQSELDRLRAELERTNTDRAELVDQLTSANEAEDELRAELEQARQQTAHCLNCGHTRAEHDLTEHECTGAVEVRLDCSCRRFAHARPSA